MESKLLKAQPVREKLIEGLKEKCQELTKKKGSPPAMKVILVGDDPASIIYTRNKKKFAEKIGAECEIVNLPGDISEANFLDKVNRIVNQKETNGAIIQLPLPSQLSHLNIGDLIPPEKDIDGFHPYNLSKLYYGSKGDKDLIPCTPKGILNLLKFYEVSLEGKEVLIMGRSTIVGKPLSMLCTNHNATVVHAHSKTQNLKEIAKRADIIVTAIGQPKFLDQSFLSPERDQIIIDVGINHDQNKKLCGDVNLDDVIDSVSKITPVPGGVGPMTILSLAQNLLQATENCL